MNNLEKSCILGRTEHSWKTLNWAVKNTPNYYCITQCQFCFLERVEPVKYQISKTTFIQGQTCQLCQKTFSERTWFCHLVEKNSQEQWIICEDCSRKYN